MSNCIVFFGNTKKGPREVKLSNFPKRKFDIASFKTNNQDVSKFF